MFQPFATGTAILVACILFSILVVFIYGFNARVFSYALWDTVLQLHKAFFTVSLIMAFAYLFNYSGMCREKKKEKELTGVCFFIVEIFFFFRKMIGIVYTIGYQLSFVGRAFPFLSAWLGWVACFLSGSDTSANTLFGNLQVVAAKEIGLSAVLMASYCLMLNRVLRDQNLVTSGLFLGLSLI